jgi:hypothetical protein
MSLTPKLDRRFGGQVQLGMGRSEIAGHNEKHRKTQITVSAGTLLVSAPELAQARNIALGADPKVSNCPSRL